MPTAFLIYGQIGAGKTTVARKLEEERQAVRFTSDEWVTTLYGAEEGSVPDFEKALGRVESVIEPLWMRCLRVGVDVVLDLGFWSRAKRDHVRQAVVSSGGTVELLSVVTDVDVAWHRVEQRNGELDGSSVEISRETFDALLSLIEALGPDEAHIDVKSDG
jgi:predicted kinase